MSAPVAPEARLGVPAFASILLGRITTPVPLEGARAKNFCNEGMGVDLLWVAEHQR